MADWSIADLLEATVDDALTFLMNFIHVPAGRRALARLKLLQEVGLGYLRLGQPINTLSGGESQRLKLVSHLAEIAASQPVETGVARLDARNTRAEVREWLATRRSKTSAVTVSLTSGEKGALTAVVSDLPGKVTGTTRRKETVPRRDTSLPLPEGDGRGEGEPPVETSNVRGPLQQGTLFLFDEPTTGLHFEDVRVLLKVFQRLVDAGHSVLVIEHNLEVIQCADWVIDLGPEAGEGGGRVVACGTPEDITRCAASHTGRFLREVLER